ncbi:pol, partial [Mucuna pruriens]
MSPYQIAFGKAFYLLVELEHRAYWAVKQCNLAYDQAGQQRKLQLQELDELRLEAYENSRIYRQKVKHFHDQQILRKEFRFGQKVLLFNSHLKLIAGKLRSRWDGPFVITNVFPYGVVELKDQHRNSTFQIKLFHEGPTPTTGDLETISLMEPAPPDINDAKVVVDFLKSNIFSRFGVPKALINDQGSHLCNRAMSALLHKYEVVHRIAIAYHPKTNGQAEVFNREIKKTLQKMANPNRKDWSQLLWGCLPTRYKAYLAVKQYNLAFDQAGMQRKLHLQELEEIRLKEYENSRIYKQKVKQFHDCKILRKEFRVGQKVLLFNSRLKLIASKLHSRWDEPLVITNIFPYGAVELKDEHTKSTFQVNWH